MRLLRPAEAAEILGCSRSTVYHLARSGKIPSVRVGDGIVRIPKEELEQFLRRRLRGGDREEGDR